MLEPNVSNQMFKDVSDDFDEKIKNITGILQNEFPNVNLSDIPGLDSINKEGGFSDTGSNFFLFLVSLLVGMFWITYITFFNARFVGKLFTKIINLFLCSNSSYIKIGSVSWSVLAGKVMFRDLCYITYDYTVSIQDGFFIFGWWFKYNDDEANNDESSSTVRNFTSVDVGNSPSSRKSMNSDGIDDGNKSLKDGDSNHLRRDSSMSNARMLFYLNGFELHIYNRLHLYQQLARQFTQKSYNHWKYIPDYLHVLLNDDDSDSKDNSEGRQRPGFFQKFASSSWSDLIRTIKLDIFSFKLILGNKTISHSLITTVSEVHLTYSTSSEDKRSSQSVASSLPRDVASSANAKQAQKAQANSGEARHTMTRFNHLVKGCCENMKVNLIPSPKYVASPVASNSAFFNDEPPRFIGEAGFNVFSCNRMNVSYHMDDCVDTKSMKDRSPSQQLNENDDVIENVEPLKWSLDLICCKSATITYGPWVHRHLDLIYYFFIPPRYEDFNDSISQQQNSLEGSNETASLEPLNFVIKFSTEEASSIDILFTGKSKYDGVNVEMLRKTEIIHFEFNKGSAVELSIPWNTPSQKPSSFQNDSENDTLSSNHNGNDTLSIALKANLVGLSAKTSLSNFTTAPIFTTECVQLNVDCVSAGIARWDSCQTWNFNFLLDQPTFLFTFALKYFIQDLVDDWSSKEIPDFLYFIPIVWNFKIGIRKFELIIPNNNRNWIDNTVESMCSPADQNAYTALCGDQASLTFKLPFTSFLAPKLNIKIKLSVIHADLCIFIPECHTSRNILFSLDSSSKIEVSDVYSSTNQSQSQQNPSKLGKTQQNNDESVHEKLSSNNTNWAWKSDLSRHKWRRTCKTYRASFNKHGGDDTSSNDNNNDGLWVDCIQAPKIQLDVNYTYHPVYVLGPRSQASPELDYDSDRRDFRVRLLDMEPDECRLRVRIDQSAVFLYGSLIQHAIRLKDNLFGCDQIYIPSKDGNRSDPLLKRKNRRNKKHNKYEAPKNIPQSNYSHISMRRSKNSTDLKNHQGHHVKFKGHRNMSFNVEDTDALHDTSSGDVRCFRHLNVIIESISAKNLKAHLMKHCSAETDPVCPYIFIEKFGLELMKDVKELRLQIAMAPILLSSESLSTTDLTNTFSDSCGDGEGGLLQLSAFQFRAQSYYSDLDLNSMLNDVVEYGWLIEVQCGSLFGSLNASQLYNLYLTFESLKFTMLDKENVVNSEIRSVLCQHMQDQRFCSVYANMSSKRRRSIVHLTDLLSDDKVLDPSKVEKDHEGELRDSTPDLECKQSETNERRTSFPRNDLRNSSSSSLCPSMDDLKYRMSRFSVDSVNVDIIQRPGKCVLNVQASFLRFASCNYNDYRGGSGSQLLSDHRKLTAVLSKFVLSQYTSLHRDSSHTWLQTSLVNFGSILFEGSIDSMTSNVHPEAVDQVSFLRKYDNESRRLYFLWANSDLLSSSDIINTVECGCLGYCHFFGGSDPDKHDFLRPEASDVTDMKNAAIPNQKVISSSVDFLSFFESMVKKGSLILDIDENHFKYSTTSRENTAPGINIDALNFDSPLYHSTEALIQSYDLDNPDSTCSDSGATTSYSTTLYSSAFPSSSTIQYASAHSSVSRFMSLDDSDEVIDDMTVREDSPNTHKMDGVDEVSSMNDFSSLDDGLSFLSARSGDSSNNGNSDGQSHDTRESVPETQGKIDEDINNSNTNMKHIIGSYMESLGNFRRRKVIIHSEDFPHALVPHFEYEPICRGFCNLEIVQRGCVEETFSYRLNMSSHLAVAENVSEKFDQNLMRDETQTSVLNIDFSHPLQVYVSPLALDSFNDSIEQLKETFSSQHPFAILTHIHATSVGLVEDKNQLKKKQGFNCFEKLDNERKISENDKTGMNAKDSGAKVFIQKSAKKSDDRSHVFERCLASTLQLSTKVPNVNVTFLQTHFDDPFAFSSSDAVQTSLCTSMLSFAVQNTELQFYKMTYAKRTVQMYINDSDLFENTRRKNRLLNLNLLHSRSKLSTDIYKDNEPCTFESSETQNENTLFVGTVSDVSLQLRRMSNESSSIQQNHRLICIPEHMSQFEFIHKGSEPYEKGYIMLECGVRDMSVKFSKSSTDSDQVSEKLSPAADSSQCSSSLSTIFTFDHNWLNFAAPPKNPKINVTNDYWDLLTTLSPTIDAWLISFRKIEAIILQCSDQYHLRLESTLAALMTEVLELDTNKYTKSAKQDKFNVLSKTMRDDPSCKLMSILRAYLVDDSENLNKILLYVEGHDDVPSLNVLREGIIVLSRQWKSILYSPVLIEYNLRCRNLNKKGPVLISLEPVLDGEEVNANAETVNQESGSDGEFDNNDDSSNENCESIDEKVLLIQNNLSAIDSLHGEHVKNSRLFSQESNANQNTYSNSLQYPLSENILSDSNSMLSEDFEEGSLQNDITCQTTIHSGIRIPISENKDDSAFSQDMDIENMKVTNDMQPEKKGMTKHFVSQMYHLLDVNVVFEPLFSSLGLLPQELPSSTLYRLGKTVSVVMNLSTVTVDIVVSDDEVKLPNPYKIDSFSSRCPPSNSNTALIIHGIELQLDLKRITNRPKNPMESGVQNTMPVYISRDQLKRYTQSTVYFQINFDSISQKINMPLLRLVNQFVNVQESFCRTNKDLEKGSENRVVSKDVHASVPSLRNSCWKTMFNLIQLYSSMNYFSSTKFGIQHRKDDTRFETASTPPKTPDFDEGKSFEPKTCNNKKGVSFDRNVSEHFTSDSLFNHEPVPMIVFGLLTVRKTKLDAVVSGLKLTAEFQNMTASAQYDEKATNSPNKCRFRTSYVSKIEHVHMDLIEGSNQTTVVEFKLAQPKIILSSQVFRSKHKDKHYATVCVDAMNIEIPQHPVSLHGIVSRGTKVLSSTIRELRGTMFASDAFRQASNKSDELDCTIHPTDDVKDAKRVVVSSETLLITPISVQFFLMLRQFRISAALLPSLKAHYKINDIMSKGSTGNKSRFSVDFMNHALSFNTVISDDIDIPSASIDEPTLPSEASVALPNVHMFAEYIVDDGQTSSMFPNPSFKTKRKSKLTNQNVTTKMGPELVPCKGDYFSAEVEVGELEHYLTTDILNHMVLVQKVFMKEINDVVQKLTGGDRPFPVLNELGELVELHWPRNDSHKLLFSVIVKLKNITITAITPANSGLRFETGMSVVNISNRLQNQSSSERVQILTNAKINIKLLLGQIVRDSIYYEADPQFLTFAYFKTTVHLVNAYQGQEMDESFNLPLREGSDLIYITLDRPLIFIQPVAVDRAILFWLSYKNAWEYWNEQRLNLNKEVLIATEEVIKKIPLSQLTHPLSVSKTMLFIQLNLTDIGVCIPLSLRNEEASNLFQEYDSHSAIVATVESSSLSSCSASSTVSKGRFHSLCLRFSDDFNHFQDDWKPDKSDPNNLMNACLVSQGSYDVCSLTERAKRGDGSCNAKWLLNVIWKMTGVDVNVDVNIGKHMSSLFHTLTSITKSRDSVYYHDCEIRLNSCSSSLSDDINLSISEDQDIISRRLRGLDYELPSFLFDPSLEKAVVSKHLENEINEQAKIVEDLQKLGASDATVNTEMKKLAELESIASKNFRQNLADKLRKHKSKASYIKEKFGLGDGNQTQLSTTIGRYNSDLGIKTLADDIDSNADAPILKTNRHRYVSNDIQTDRSSSHNIPPEEPVDFELIITVFVNSGKCVLHTDDFRKSCSSDDLDTVSTSFRSGKKSSSRNDKRLNTNDSHKRVNQRGANFFSSFSNLQSSSRLRDTEFDGMLSNVNVFNIPGLDVRVHYNSLVVYSDETSTCLIPPSGNKQATMKTWATLQSIPEETVITPKILEFLDRVLEPLPDFDDSKIEPVDTSKDDKVHTSQSHLPTSDSDGEYHDELSATSSFPVNVIVYVNMQSSRFRFSCLPVSRVECLLTLPSMDLMFSSKLTENCPDSDNNETQRSNTTNVGGMNITGRLNDFYLCVFHPYGGTGSNVTSSNPSEFIYSSLASEERKESLSVEVESITFNITRSRVLNLVESELSQSTNVGLQQNACIRFGTIVKIGSAVFTYDMRRLSEILAFPKAWYRRTLLRRLFLGDTNNSTRVEREAQRDAHHKTMPQENASEKLWIGETAANSWETLVMTAIEFKELKICMNMGNVCGNVKWVSTDFRSLSRLSISSSGHKNMVITVGLKNSLFDAKGGIVGGAIRLGQNFTVASLKEDEGIEPFHKLVANLDACEIKFDYMGTCVLMIRIGSLSVTLNDDWHVLEILEKRKKQTEKVDIRQMSAAQVFVEGDINWDQLQVMISKSTTADLLKIIHKLNEFFSQQFQDSKRLFYSLDSPSNKSSGWRHASGMSSNVDFSIQQSREGFGRLNHHRHWQKAMNKISGLKIYTLPFKTPEIGSILGGVFELRGKHISLACFHGINFKAKSWALFSLKSPFISFVSDAQQFVKPCNDENGDSFSSTDDDTSKFKSVINIIQTISFSLGEYDAISKVKSGSVNLGESSSSRSSQTEIMATVKKISRSSVNYIPQVKELNEWFEYAFSSSKLDEVERFPANFCDEYSDDELAAGTTKNVKDKIYQHHQRTEDIFFLPSLRMDLKTVHIQYDTPTSYSFKYQDKDQLKRVEISFDTSKIVFDEDVSNEKPTVECFFVADFANHIYVTTDAEAIFFLHEIISSYVKEKRRVLTIQQGSSTSSSFQSGSNAGHPRFAIGGHFIGASQNSDRSSPPHHLSIDPLQNDWRTFNCKVWDVEPTVRLISGFVGAGVGRDIEPPLVGSGMDYILHRLGFTHARLTIPKWIQRGFMDPLDNVLSLVVLKMIESVKESSSANNDTSINNFNNSEEINDNYDDAKDNSKKL